MSGVRQPHPSKGQMITMEPSSTCATTPSSYLTEADPGWAKLTPAQQHEHRVRRHLAETDPGWKDQKHRGWYFDILDSGDDDDRYFAQIREQEIPAFQPLDDNASEAQQVASEGVEYQAAMTVAAEQ